MKIIYVGVLYLPVQLPPLSKNPSKHVTHAAAPVAEHVLQLTSHAKQTQKSSIIAWIHKQDRLSQVRHLYLKVQFQKLHFGLVLFNPSGLCYLR